MGKKGNERPFVVATRLSPEEKALFDQMRGGVSPAVYLRWLIRHGKRP